MIDRRLLAALITLLAVLASNAVSADETAPYFPTAEEWETVAPTDAGADPAKLESALAFAEKHKSKGVVILWRGRIVAERYWRRWSEERPHAAYSVTKSVISTLVGIAIAERKIEGPEQSVAHFLPEWKGKEEYEAITVGHLLSMTGGLEGGGRTFRRGLRARDERAFATGLPVEHPPGTRWEYHNSAYRLLFSVLEAATGTPPPEYLSEKLLTPLGMTRTRLGTKWFARDQYTYMTTTARDAARFGLLVLRNGEWQGKQCVPKEWLARATAPIHPDVNPSYGYLWWLNGGGHHFLPLRPRKKVGPIFPGCPEDAFAALGKDDQKIYVVPSLDLVVTRFGDAARASANALSGFDAEFLGRVCGSFEKPQSTSRPTSKPTTKPTTKPTSRPTPKSRPKDL